MGVEKLILMPGAKTSHRPRYQIKKVLSALDLNRSLRDYTLIAEACGGELEKKPPSRWICIIVHLGEPSYHVTHADSRNGRAGQKIITGIYCILTRISMSLATGLGCLPLPISGIGDCCISILLIPYLCN